jgi:hypothetical protein
MDQRTSKAFAIGSNCFDGGPAPIIGAAAIKNPSPVSEADFQQAAKAFQKLVNENRLKDANPEMEKSIPFSNGLDYNGWKPWNDDLIHPNPETLKSVDQMWNSIHDGFAADFAIEFAEWIQNHGWEFGDGSGGVGWYNRHQFHYVRDTKDLLAKFIKSKTPKPKTDQERIAELEKQVAELKSQMVGFGKGFHK